jgi:glycosyltransferase involved in cell wall biosynthesis
MKKLNILFTTSHADTLGNACRLDMVKYLVANFDTTIFTNQLEFIQGLFTNENILPVNWRNRAKVPLLADYLYWKHLAGILNSVPSDGVFMFHDDSPATIWIKKPVFQYIHQYGKRGIENKLSLKSFFKSQIEKIIHRYFLRGFNKSSQNFVVSKFLIDYFKNEGVSNLELIPHAMELNKFRKPVIDNNHTKLSKLQKAGYFIIAYTGWVTEYRGYQLMMDSIKRIVAQNKKVVLVIAGADSNFSKRVKEFQEKFQLEDNIINYGVVDASIIPGILHFSNIGLSFLEDSPAHRVSPPQKIFEYFAAGKPVICNKIQTHSMFVKNQKTGFALNMDSNEVADAVLELISNNELYQQMCVNAANESLKYDMDVVYGKMVKTINEKLNEF